MVFNLEIERAMIGCILLGKTEYIHKLNEDDFTTDCLKEILRAMKTLDENGQAVDIIIVADMLPKISNILEILINIMDNVPTPENAGRYFQILKEYSVRRKLENAAHAIIEKVNNYNYESITECKADVLKLVDIPVNDFKKRSFELKAILTETLDDMEKQYNSKNDNRLLTGFYDLDKITAGLHPEELTIVAARPGVGKTVFAINMMANLAKKGVKCVLISREMSTKQLAKRIIANTATIDGNKLRIVKALSDEDWAKIGKALGEVMNWPIIINDELATIQEIRAYCRELKTKDAIDALFVDYLQLCRSSAKVESRRHEIEDVSRQLKEISMELGIPVVALCQLSRDSAKAGRVPELHDLRESGAIEQDADNVIFLHIPKDTDDTQDQFDIQVIVGKQRNGPTGYIYLRMYKRVFKLYNLSKQG